MEIVGYGVNIKYKEQYGYERVATYAEKEEAEKAYEIIKKAYECSRAKAIEIVEIQYNHGDYDYVTIKEEVK